MSPMIPTGSMEVVFMSMCLIRASAQHMRSLEALEDRFVVCDPGDVECASDSNGHGTHCAATVGGAMMGVAKNVTLHAVKVLNTVGTGSISSIISAIDWIMQNAIKPAVITMSLSNVGAIE